MSKAYQKALVAFCEHLKKPLDWETEDASKIRAQNAFNNALDEIIGFTKHYNAGKIDPDFIESIIKTYDNKMKGE